VSELNSSFFGEGRPARLFISRISTARNDRDRVLSHTGVRFESHAPSPHGFRVLHLLSVYQQAVVIRPVARCVLITRGTADSNRSPAPSSCGLHRPDAKSTATLVVSRHAARSRARRYQRLLQLGDDSLRQVTKGSADRFPRGQRTLKPRRIMHSLVNGLLFFENHFASG
jgi:hypothetical protein